MATKYADDFCQWTVEQADYLKLGKFDQLDLENLAEEIISLGKQQQQELKNRLGVLIGHLLKWEYQPDKRSRSWQVTIQLQRSEIIDILSDNPSLKSSLDSSLIKGYRIAKSIVLGETNIRTDLLPESCPYTWFQLVDFNFPDSIDREF